MRGRVALITTGGTIASRPDGHGAASASLSADDLLQDLPSELRERISEVRSPMCVNSWDIGPSEMMEIRTHVVDLLENTDVDGVVVTHGTDTLEETAVFLDITVAADKPVVLTGAMRSAGHPRADGPANLRDSIIVALDDSMIGLGTVACFNGSVHAARWTRKRHSLNLDAFEGPVPPLARIDDRGGISRRAQRLSRWNVPGGEDSKPLEPDQIPILHVYSGMSHQAAHNAISSQNASGLVIDGFGSGNVPKHVVDVAGEFLDRQLPVVLSSRCDDGGVCPAYSGPGGGASLLDMGVISAGALSAAKARIVLFALGERLLSETGKRDLADALAVLGSDW